MGVSFRDAETLGGAIDVPFTPVAQHQTREEWLQACVNAMRPLLAEHGATIPDNIKVSCGFPFGRRGITSLHAIGQAWPASLSSNGSIEIFISPVLDDAARVADVLAHECVHAAVGNDKGHGPVFKQLAEAIVLTGKITATIAGEKFKRWWSGQALGDYPHAKVIVIRDPSMPKGPQGPDGPSLPVPRIPGGAIIYRPQTTRMVRCWCEKCAEEEGESYIIRTARNNLTRLGPPICPKPGHGTMTEG